MFQAFFTGLSGMFSFTKNLNNVSNNIANMNTPGFKGSDTFYRSLTGGESGIGTQIAGENQRFTNGEIRQTGKSGDLAIGGDGFFMLMQDGQVRYTRAGQFIFDEDGILIDSVTKAQVAAVNDSGQLEVINIGNKRVLAPSATTKVNFLGNLSTEDTTHEVGGIKVFNGLGEEVELKFTFTNNKAVLAGSWTVKIEDTKGNTLANGEIRFAADGTSVNDFSNLSLELTDSHGGKDTVTFSFGKNADFSNSTSVAGGADSTLQARVDDGSAVAALTSVKFEADGRLKLVYSNGKEVDGPALGIANFSDVSVLSVHQGSVFEAADIDGRTVGRGGAERHR